MTHNTKTIDELMNEVDANVKKLVEIFAFLLKYRVLFKGTGIEFVGLREYVPGQDDATKIDWKASLRAQRLFIKQYEEERDLDIFVLLDSSASMLFGTQKKLKSEYAAVVAGAIVFSAIETGDNVGFAMFNEKVEPFLTPSQDPSQYYNILSFMVNPKYYGGKCDLKDSLLFLLNNLEEKTVLFIISDFIGIGNNWKSPLKMVSAKINRVVGIMVRDLRDSFLPHGTGYIRFKDPFSENFITVNLDNIRIKYEKLAARQERNIEKAFLEAKAGFVKIYTHEPFVEPLIRYLQLIEEI